MLRITEYWNKVIDDNSAPFKRRVLKDEYEIKSSFTINNTLNDLRERWKGDKHWTFYNDKIIEDCGRYYGIHSYREIKEEL